MIMHAPRLAGIRVLAFAPLVGLVAIGGGTTGDGAITTRYRSTSPRFAVEASMWPRTP